MLCYEQLSRAGESLPVHLERIVFLRPERNEVTRQEGLAGAGRHSGMHLDLEVLGEDAVALLRHKKLPFTGHCLLRTPYTIPTVIIHHSRDPGRQRGTGDGGGVHGENGGGQAVIHRVVGPSHVFYLRGQRVPQILGEDPKRVHLWQIDSAGETAAAAGAGSLRQRQRFSRSLWGTAQDERNWRRDEGSTGQQVAPGRRMDLPAISVTSLAS